MASSSRRVLTLEYFTLRLRRRASALVPTTEAIGAAIDSRVTNVVPAISIETRNVGNTITTTIRQTRQRHYLFGVITITRTNTARISETTV